MKNLSKNELKTFEGIARLNQETLREVLHKFLIKNYKKVIYDKQFLCAEGDIPIALVAHMDTVFKKPPTEIFYDRVKNVMISPTGLGADDRAGIYSIIQIVESGLRPHIIFTTDEEIGCIGAMALSTLDCPFKDLRYMIQLDRRNSNDCVFYDCDNKDFEQYIEKFGFITAWGSFTDICELGPAWGVAGVNLSIGYRDEHTASEVLFVGQMLSTIEKVKNMLKEKDIPSFKYVPTKYAYNYYGLSLHPNDYYGVDDSDYLPYLGKKAEVTFKCHGCQKTITEVDPISVKLIKGGRGFFCEDCIYNGKIDWCWKCGEPYQIDKTEKGCGFCKDCRKKK